jgi:pyruvate/2-oxoglutarate dehydrogenase complex dihydrolipoamide acyltransferase (E2) component
MRFEMKMPDLAATDSAIKVLNWLIEVGNPVRQGQAVIEVETDKATMEVEATVNGMLVEKKCDPHMDVDVGQVIAIIEIEEYGEPVSSPDAEITPALSIEKSPAPVLSPAPKKGAGLFSRNRAARKTPPVRDELLASIM